MSKNIDIYSKQIRMQLWDSSGQKKYRGLIPSYLRNSSGIILMYDITNLESFKNLESWMNLIDESEKNAYIILIGNKCNLENER